MEKIDINNLDFVQEQEIIAMIREQYPEVKWPDVSQERLLVVGAPDPVASHFANIRWDADMNPTVMAVVSKDYKFLRYEVLVAAFQQMIESEYSGETIAKPKVIGDGEKFRMTMEFPELESNVKAGAKKVGDLIRPSAGFETSLDTVWSYHTFVGALRLVCLNGMTAFQLEQETRSKHRGNLDITAENAIVHPTLDRFNEQMEVWRSFDRVELNTEAIEELIDASPFGNRHKEEILALPETSTGETIEQWINKGRASALDMFNVFNQFVTHNIESEMVRATRNVEIGKLFNRFAKAA